MAKSDPIAGTATDDFNPWCLTCVAMSALISVVLVIVAFLNLGFPSAANYSFAALIGIATGGTELMSRFRDRPLAVVVSGPGLFYMAINGGASILALFLITQWHWIDDDPIKRVLVAGISAMAVFRAGLFTTKIGNKEVALGPNLILKVVLDVLDREYDRKSAFRRSGIIAEAMGGIDFKQARTSLTELCFSLMQNVTGEEREALQRHADYLDELGDETLGEAKAMALGLSLIGIVGEDTLKAAAIKLGASIVGFKDLSVELSNLLLKRAPEDVLVNLYALCNQLAHERLRLKQADLDETLKGISAMGLPPLVASRVVAIQVRQNFGEGVLKAALEMLPAPQEGVVPAAPPLPPSTPPVAD